jgi:hypothetical protein
MKASEIQSFITEHADLCNNFYSICAQDTIPQIFPVHKACIVNTARSSEPGKHWYLIIRRSERHFEVFDSLGTSASAIANNLPFSPARCTFNKTRVQAEQSVLCAQYCLYFLTTRFMNYDLKFDDVINLYFTDNVDENDEIVNRFVLTNEFLEPDYD